MKNNYSLSETISNVYALLCTKMFYKGARLVRRPFYCRGKFRLQFAEGFTTGHHCRFDILGEAGDNSKKLFIGKNCKLGDNVHIVVNKKVVIGDNCLMASKIFISDTNHGNYSGITIDSSPDVPPDERPLYMKCVSIGNNVWIGENVCILPGVSIGDGCIIGANSVVNRDIPDSCIVAGSPVRVIKGWDATLKMWIKIEIEKYSQGGQTSISAPSTDPNNDHPLSSLRSESRGKGMLK